MRSVAEVTALVADQPMTGTAVRWKYGWLIVDEAGCHALVHDRAVIGVRPLVVIDPEDREQVERLAIAYTVIASARSGDEYRAWENRSKEARARIRTELAAALREFANPTPPKPDEPTGLGAVVEDERGRRFVRIDPEDARFPWVLARDPKSNAFNWTDFGGLDGAERITVVSEGVDR